MYCAQYHGPVTEPEQLHPQRDKLGFSIVPEVFKPPPEMFLRSAFFSFLAFFIMFMCYSFEIKQ